MTEPTLPAPPRVVVDTSTALPVLTLKGPPDHWLAELWKSKLIIPLATNETMAELQEQVIRHSPVTRDNQVRLFVNRTMRGYEALCEFVPRPHLTNAPQCRDTKDQMFIDLAIAGQAEFLLARDPDLLVMGPETTFRILHDHHARGVLVRNL